MRILWVDKTTVEVNFYAKGEGKCQMVVKHSKLASAREATKTKKFWQAALARLQTG